MGYRFICDIDTIGGKVDSHRLDNEDGIQFQAKQFAVRDVK